MKDQHISPKVKTWLADPLPKEVAASIRRLAEIEDVRHIAVLPDVHLAGEVCVGLAVATRNLIVPDAVGGDIGCGMITAALDVPVSALADEETAMKLLSELRRVVPVIRQGSAGAAEEIFDIVGKLSDPRLGRIARRDGRVEFGTLGGGNHFLEFQADEDNRLWILIHSGSRAMGPAIRDFHLAKDDEVDLHGISGGSVTEPLSLRFLDARTDCGQAYLADAAWARRYASASRRRMLVAAAEAAGRVIGGKLDESSIIESDHNHVQQETHFGELWWVHRKGSACASAGKMGILPGSMGTPSFHVEGRGCEQSLCSSAHGAGRAMTRTEARRRISLREFSRQTGNVWIDPAHVMNLLEESPSAYKDIAKVLRAQRDLVKVVRKLRPVLNYKGTDRRG